MKLARAVTFYRDDCCIFSRTCFKEDTEDSTNDLMTLCRVLYEWYHKKCMKISMNVFQRDSIAKPWRSKSWKQI